MQMTPDRSLEARTPRSGEIRVFASFDVEHDRELYDLLLAQSDTPGVTFVVSGASERFSTTQAWSDRARLRIREADQVIVICGEYTDESMGVFSELRIAHEEQKPYFLLWGYRESMCKKPAGARATDGMFSWTTEILSDQVWRASRSKERETATQRLRRDASNPRYSGGSPR